MDACWTIATQPSCRSFVTLSCMSAGVVLLYLSLLYLLVWCLTFSRACWCDASLKAILSGVVPHYQLCQLVQCLIIGFVFWCGASLSAVPAGAVSHYRPCLLVPYYRLCQLVPCLIIGLVFWCGGHYQPCLLMWYLTIGHAF